MKVKIFNDDNTEILEDEINEWLTENRVEISDIRYSICKVGNYETASALILYREILPQGKVKALSLEKR